MKILLLDESGDHSLSKIDPQYPIFVLAGVIVDAAYAASELDERLRAFKQRLFGRDDLILHTADIVRQQNGFEALADPAFRAKFYTHLNTLMSQLDYMVVACVIKKYVFHRRYGTKALDPYMFSLEVLVERFCYELGNRRGAGRMVAEKRNSILDSQIDLAWRRLKVEGTRYLQAATLRNRIIDLELRPKRDNLAGLQLADLVASPIGRFVLGKPTREDWRIVESKFRRRDGDYRGAGLVVLPKK
ncbi:MAG: DUF3800 domain-containing protein [Sphaerobacter sp.]|nr:DUF3800 domain-containing protein [Sphaerobacter sp.]